MATQDDARTAYIGRGLNFPMRVNALGTVELITGDRDIQQSIMVILGTRCGERVMRPEFGCRVHELMFEPRDAVMIGKIEDYVRDALAHWEPRIDVLSVVPQYDTTTDGAVVVTIEYQIKSSHDQRSIVYPFFIEQQEEW